MNKTSPLAKSKWTIIIYIYVLFIRWKLLEDHFTGRLRPFFRIRVFNLESNVIFRYYPILVLLLYMKQLLYIYI